MIKISEEEFEARIQDVISGRISRIDLAQELQTDIRTLNKKIIEEIGVNNPDLYIEYIKKFPYKQKERDDIDYEALVIEMVKNRTYTEEAAIKYGVSVKTIQRRVIELEQENPYLFRIYKEVKQLNKNNIELPLELQRKIEKLVIRPVKISEVNATRREELEEIERIYNNRCQYVSRLEAAESMGFSKHRIYKSLNDLYRMRVEENYTKMEDTFKDSLKVDVSPAISTEHEETDGKVEIQKEGEEK